MRTLKYENSEAPIDPGEWGGSDREIEGRTELFRGEITKLKEAEERKEEKRDTHFANIEPDLLTQEEMFWYDSLKGINFSSPDSITEYRRLAALFEETKRKIFMQTEEKYVNLPEDKRIMTINEFVAKDPMFNFYMWLGNKFMELGWRARVFSKTLRPEIGAEDAA